MRLIDADKLKIDSLSYHGRVCVSQSQIADAPTVPAIPLERIKQLREEILNLVGYQEGIDTMGVGDDIMISWVKTLDKLDNMIKEYSE